MPTTAAVPLIKGYLPVRLRLPSATDDDVTFFYVKEHSGEERNTLFVANCPTVSGCRTKLLLQSIFGRYGEVTRVTVVPNPRQTQQHTDDNSISNWTANFAAPTYHQHHHSTEGKFAHVVFTSTKEMKRTLKALQEIMSSSSSSDEASLPALQLDTIELQTLSDETDRQWRDELDDDGELQQDDDDDTNEKTPASGILAVAARYRASCQRLSDRDKLLAECNAVMRAFESAEAEERRKRNEAVPDDDGFVTVSYSAAVGSKRDLEGGAVGESSSSNKHKDHRGRMAAGPKRHRSSSNNKKKGNGGAEPLPDFYRFQTREHRKKGLQELRQRFEEDLVKVKKMKEERHYRPF
jgi:ribosomal RNA-processing protein 7